MPRGFCLALLVAASTAQAADPVALGTRRELFVDHLLIDKLDGAQLALGRPHDEGPVLKFDKPWEGQFSGYCTVIADGPVYRLYYRGHPGGGKEAFRTEVTCYAESRDGRTWVKPDLGLVEWGGSKANNIILPPGETYHWATHNFTPFLDARPGVAPSEWFKALGGVQQSGGLYALASPDGTHWSRLRPEPVFNVPTTAGAPKPYGLDSQNVAFWSEAEGRYVGYIRTWEFDVRKHGLRRIARITSPDFLTWSRPAVMEYRDATGRPSPAEDLYTNQTHPYFRAPHIGVAVAARFMAGRQVVTADQAKALGMNAGYFRDTSDGVFMTTRGGTVYDRTFPEGFLRPGIGLSNWVSRTNYPALNVVPTGPAEMSIFVNQDYVQPTAHLRRYSLRLDGLASLRAGAAGGTMTTKPLTFAGRRLVLNFATSAAGEIRVGLCDAGGQPIPGFAVSDCRPMIGNEIEREVTWSAGVDPARHAGRPVRLVFQMQDADVFSFRFTDSPLVAAESNLPAPVGSSSAVLTKEPNNLPSMVEADGRLRLRFGEERLVMPRGLQPYMLCTRTGALVVQAQVPEKPFPSDRMTYPWAMSTVVSRDGGKSWTRVPLKRGDNGLNMEGGAVQLRDGTILALDTYIMPGKKPYEGVGQLYTSADDWRNLDGPTDVPFDLPGIKFGASTDDGGRPHNAQRLHRRILELPSGDLLTTLYGHKTGDSTPSTYAPTMMKTRMMLARSSDRGRHWALVSDGAVDPKVGTEGLGEPVLCRVGKGPNAGRLICLMRTGRNLYEAVSDDDGRTWTPARPRVFAGLDVNRTELWADMFRDFKDFKGKPLDESNPDELKGAVVDPDLIELRSGLLVAAFGVRVPQKLCWRHPEHPWNGNYLAFSQDHGRTWPNVVRITSGVLTTHYMAVEETPTDNTLFVAYDLGGWSKGMRRDVYGRTVQIAIPK